MSRESKIAWAVVGGLAAVLGALFLPGKVRRELRPEPVGAFVAIQVAGEDFATEGRVEVAAGTSFRLHAVLEAAGRGGRRVFFTQAPALVVGGARIPAADVRPWPGPEKAKVLWFSVEGARPLVELPEGTALDSFRFQQIFRPDWPRAWSIPGTLLPAREAAAGGFENPAERPFGTQRFHVRIELFGVASTLVPVATHDSLPADALPAAADRFPTVIASLPGPLGPPSRVFGLSQLDLQGAARSREAEALQAWYEADLAFSYVALLRAMVDRAGVSWEDLEWRALEIAAGPAWSPSSVAAGDLLRAGERVVVLYEDRGAAGLLDYEDLCFDFRAGARVLSLGEVFSGAGLVEWTRLRPAGERAAAAAGGR